jgi:hypothetical protein
MPAHPEHIFDLLGVKVGSLAVADVQKDRWGQTITVDFVYTYPPEKKPFKLVFTNCRAFEWYVLKAPHEMPTGETVNVITHELGQPNHQRTARIATVAVEIIISYGALTVEKDW